MQRLCSWPYRFPLSTIPGARVYATVMEKKRRMDFRERETKQSKALSLRKSNARSARSISYVQIFGTGMDTGETSPCVLLFFDSKRFLFNAGEGLQRFCQENKIKLSKIDHVLLTRVCSETAGGLAGALLTLAGDIGLTLNIWGPSDLQCLVTAMSTYLPNASFFYTHSFGKDGKLLPEHALDPSVAILLEDDVVKISAVLLVPTRDDQAEGKSIKAGDVAVVYICELPDVRGKFDPAKAAALGLRPGPKFAILQTGKSVLSDDGSREICPESVMDPTSPGPKVILVDCPTTNHIPSLLTATGLKRLYADEGCSSVVCVVHMSPAAVINDAKYQHWMSLFGSTQHILAGSGCSNSPSPILKSSAKILSKLNFACPNAFPIPGYGYEPLESQTISMQQENLSVTTAGNLLKFRLLPLTGLGLDTSSVPESFDAKVHTVELLDKVPEIIPVTDQLKQLWNDHGSKDLVEEPWLDKGTDSHQLKDSNSSSEKIPDELKALSRKEVELIFLGTGSSHPSTYRNVSAIYLHLFANGGILLDCGEGTYGQLLRRFGSSTDSVLAGLRLVWISHIHADHHGGLARILSVRRKLLSKTGSGIEPLLVVGPKQLKRVLDAYNTVEDLEVEFLDCSQTTLEALEIASGKQPKGLISSVVSCSQPGRVQRGQRGYHLRSGLDETGRSKLREILSSIGLSSLVSVPVLHCEYAFGVVIQAENKTDASKAGWKLAYSGDTRPCEAFIRASDGATVFIHEATFEAGMLEEAMAKMHSSTGEAIEAGVLARAYRTILTHFSQRYSKVPVFDDSYNDTTCVAFDLMSIDLVDLPLLPSLVPILKLLFKEDDQQSDEQQGDDEDL